jgi:hypothetical protein
VRIAHKHGISLHLFHLLILYYVPLHIKKVTQKRESRVIREALCPLTQGVPFRPLHCALISLFSYKHGKMSYIPCENSFGRNLLSTRGIKRSLFLEEERKEKKGIAEENEE